MERQVRLVDGSSDHEGVVEIFLENSWRTVCSPSWTNLEASMVCRQLNFLTPTSSKYIVTDLLIEKNPNKQVSAKNCS